MLTLFRIHQSKNLIHILFVYLFLEIRFCSVSLLSLELTIVNQTSLELAAQFTPLTSERRGLYRCTATPGLMFFVFKRQVPFPDLWDKDVETQKEREKQTKPVPKSYSLWQSRDQGFPVLALTPDHCDILLLPDSYRDCLMLLGHLRKLVLKVSERNPVAQFRWGILLFSPSWNVSISSSSRNLLWRFVQSV